MEQAGTWAAAWLATFQAGHPMPAAQQALHFSPPDPSSSSPREAAGFNSCGLSHEVTCKNLQGACETGALLKYCLLSTYYAPITALGLYVYFLVKTQL